MNIFTKKMMNKIQTCKCCGSKLKNESDIKTAIGWFIIAIILEALTVLFGGEFDWIFFSIFIIIGLYHLLRGKNVTSCPKGCPQD